MLNFLVCYHRICRLKKSIGMLLQRSDGNRMNKFFFAGFTFNIHFLRVMVAPFCWDAFLKQGQESHSGLQKNPAKSLDIETVILVVFGSNHVKMAQSNSKPLFFPETLARFTDSCHQIWMSWSYYLKKNEQKREQSCKRIEAGFAVKYYWNII